MHMSRAAMCRFPVRDADLARLVARSDMIVLGSPRQDVAVADGDSRYVRMPVSVEKTLKSNFSDPAPDLRVYLPDPEWRPSNEAITAAAGQPAVLFLVRSESTPVSLYFEGPDAIHVATAERVEAVEEEIRRQEVLLKNWQADETLPHYGTVKRLVDELAGLDQTVRSEDSRWKKQERILRRLEALGQKAVPAIIAHMDDRRELAFQKMSLTNDWPDAFEGLRHYSPERIVDALAAILNQLTAENFGFIYSGATERERRAAVAGWRVYAEMLLCGDAKPAD